MSDSQDQTDSAQTRWAYTNDVIAGFLILSFVLILAAPLTPQVASHENLNPALVGGYLTGFGVAITWVFGPDAMAAWNKQKGDG